MLPHNGASQLSDACSGCSEKHQVPQQKIQYVESLDLFLVDTICEAILLPARETNCRLTDCSDSMTFRAITLEFL